MKDLVIAHISDSHISNNRAEFKKDFFMKAVNEINRLSPGLTIHTGDLTDNGLKEEFEMAKDLVSWFEKKPVILMGNHDAKNVGYRLFEDYIGPRDVIVENEHFLLVGVDSSIPDRNEGKFGKMHMKWVADVLGEKGDGKIKIVAFHHHLVPVPNAGRERSMIYDAGDVLKLVLDHGVDIVLNGHRHVYSIHGVEDALIISTGTLSHFKTRGYHGRSYNLIKVSDKGVRVIVRRLDIDHKEEYIKKARRVERLVQVKLPRIARVIQISDTYFMGDGLFDRRVYDVATTIINRLKPDVVAHCGNITEDGMHETFEEAEKLLKKVKAPLIAVPGPHDLMNIGDLVFEDYVGGLNPLFQNENIIIVGVNSSQRDYTGGVIGRKNLERILGKLNKAGKKTVKLVAFHHHLMPLPYVREEEVLEDTADVLRNMIGNADIVLTGDRSISSCLMVDGCLVINSGTLCRKQYQDPYGNSFNLIDIFANRTVMVSEFSIPAGSKRVLGTYLIRSGVSDIDRGTKK